MPVITILIFSLVTLLTLLLGGWDMFGWILVGLISLALLFFSFVYIFLPPIIRKINKNHIKNLERAIKEKEDAGYTDEDLTSLKTKLKYLNSFEI